MFKKIITLTLTLVFSSLVFTSAFADDIKLEYNNEIIDLANPPVIINGRTLVPMREMFELMGFEIRWESETRTAIGKYMDYEVSFPIDKHKYNFGSTESELDVPAQIIDGTTFIPLRVLVDTVGANIQWNANLNKVDIDTGQIDKAIEFKDNQLAESIVQELDLGSSDDITYKLARFVERLDLSQNSIYTIDGLENFINLRHLDLSENHIEIINDLSSLNKLIHLDLKGNNVEDTWSLKPLIFLNYLDISNNKLDDLIGLENHQNIKILYLDNNDLKVKDDSDDPSVFGPLFYYPQDVVFDVDRSIFSEPDYNTWNLRNRANFETEVYPDIFWIPAAYLGKSNLDFDDMDSVFINQPQGQRVKLGNLYETIQFLQYSPYNIAATEKTSLDSTTDRIWTYSKTPYDALDDFESSKLGLASTTASILQNDYNETGTLLIYDVNGSLYPLTYIRNEEVSISKDDNNDNVISSEDYYYIFDSSTYLESSIVQSALEDGILETYNNSGKEKANIHKTKDLKKFAEYYLGSIPAGVITVSHIDDIDKSYPIGTYTSERGVNGTYVFFPRDTDEERAKENPNLIWDNRYNIIFDNPEDTIFIKIAENFTETPERN